MKLNSCKMSRLGRNETNLLVATVIALRADCERAKVGCVITNNHRIVSSGYNGPLFGTDCSQANCHLTEKCKHAVHAEANAIAAASRQGISLLGGTLYCTHCPCYDCAKLIVQSGITQVVYLIDYKTSTDGYNLLEEAPTITISKFELTPQLKALYDQIKNYSY
jgi:dCMP deaminase